jgi:hypothetical protein
MDAETNKQSEKKMNTKTILEMFKPLHDLGIPLEEFPFHFDKNIDMVEKVLQRRKEMLERAKKFQKAKKEAKENPSLKDFKQPLNEEDKLLVEDIEYEFRRNKERKAAAKEAPVVQQVLNEKRPRTNTNSTSVSQPSSSYVVVTKTNSDPQTGESNTSSVVTSVRAPGHTVPPGYEYVNTKGDGDCMFYSVYYAWNPEKGTDEAQEPDSALEIRQIIYDTVKEEDLFDINNLLLGIKESIKIELQDAASDMWRSQSDILEDADIYNIEHICSLLESYKQIKDNENSANISQIALQEYKDNLILNQSFWGDNRELSILNKYAQANRLPNIIPFNVNYPEQASWFNVYQVKSNNSDRWISKIRKFPNGVAPIHFNGTNHYSMLKEVEGEEAKIERKNYLEEQMAKAIQRDPLLVMNSTAGGKRKTRKNRKPKKRTTRKH